MQRIKEKQLSGIEEGKRRLLRALRALAMTKRGQRLNCFVALAMTN